ncbi:hypothetical protein DYGSA30_18550 [Dyella sp. GSA-30]|nr:hypothetical protein DYGSA30_18550 [Dyella sp. GSA-30]
MPASQENVTATAAPLMPPIAAANRTAQESVEAREAINATRKKIVAPVTVPAMHSPNADTAFLDRAIEKMG